MAKIHKLGATPVGNTTQTRGGPPFKTICGIRLYEKVTDGLYISRERRPIEISRTGSNLIVNCERCRRKK